MLCYFSAARLFPLEGLESGRRKARCSRLIKRRWREWPGWVSGDDVAVGRIGSGEAGRRGSLQYKYGVCITTLVGVSDGKGEEACVLRAVMTEEWQSEVHLTGR